jgi:hypothetical protein
MKKYNTSSRVVVAVFDSDHDILAAAKALRAAGYTILESFTPYAVHGLDKVLGQRASRLPLVCLFFALSGAAAKLWFQVWTSATSWPVNVGGKPLASVPAFVPVTFEVTVLFAGLGTVAAFLLRSRLWPGKGVRTVHQRVTDDGFALLIDQDNAAFDYAAVERICRAHGMSFIEERVEGAE